MIIHNLQEFLNLVGRNVQLIGIDYGARKLGVAISNEQKTFALPLCTIEVEPIKSIQKIVSKYFIGGIVLGIPIKLDGNKSEQTLVVEKFAQNLSKNIDIPIFLVDERLTTKAANNILKAYGFNRKERAAKDDMVSACIILESVLSLKYE